MAKIFVVMGKSASGKDSVFKKMVDMNIGLKTVVSYTTRPIRMNERDGIEYYFITKDVMDQYLTEGKIIECRSYNTVHGWWHYFTADDGQIDLSRNSYILIGTLEAYKKLIKYYGSEAVIPIYIKADDKERLMRAINREGMQGNPNYSEVCRRYLADELDFSDENLKECGISGSYDNNDLNSCSEAVMKDIIKMM